MATSKLTVRSIEALKAQAVRGSKDVFAWDTEVKGFGVKASAKGGLSFVVQKSIGGRDGKRKRIVIGHYPAKDIDTARKEAGKAVSDVHNGIDFIEVKKQTKEVQKERLVHALLPTFERYVAKRGDLESRYWSENVRLFRNHIAPQLGNNTPVASITKADIRKLIDDKEESHPDAARNWFALLRPFFKWCVERDILVSSPMEHLIAPKLAASRDRKLSELEIRVFWKATEGMSYPFGPFYKLLLLTAQRREEVAAADWSEIDLAKGEWIIPKERTKNGKEHLVHMSPQAIEVLKSLPTNKGLLFTTTGETPISGYSNAKEKLDALCASITEADYPEFLSKIFQTEWRVHDLRRTAASGMAELGFQPHIVERVLNHISGAQGGLVGVYQRFDYANERKRALEAWATYLDQLNAVESESNLLIFNQKHKI